MFASHLWLYQTRQHLYRVIKWTADKRIGGRYDSYLKFAHHISDYSLNQALYLLGPERNLKTTWQTTYVCSAASCWCCSSLAQIKTLLFPLYLPSQTYRHTGVLPYQNPHSISTILSRSGGKLPTFHPSSPRPPTPKQSAVEDSSSRPLEQTLLFMWNLLFANMDTDSLAWLMSLGF